MERPLKERYQKYTKLSDILVVGSWMEGGCKLDLALIGLGPWGLAFLERLVTMTRRRQICSGQITLHVVEPGAPGVGVYSLDEPDYLLLNNPCGQLSLHPDPDVGPEFAYAKSLYEWARDEGYRQKQGRWSRRGSGRPPTPHDFLPRRLMGEYLSWFYQRLLEELPLGVELVRYPELAVDIATSSGGREEVRLEGGHSFEADHVVICPGHTSNWSFNPNLGRIIDPYPISALQKIPAGVPVAVAGMGLVAIDVVIALTEGRGGRFVRRGDRLSYKKGGHEPEILLFSRSGLAYCAKAVAASDRTGSYEPSIATPALLRELGAGAWTSKKQGIDFRQEVVPLLLAEMELAYYSQAELLRRGKEPAADLASFLTRAWQEDQWSAATSKLAKRLGSFDAAEHFFGLRFPNHLSSKDYEGWFYELVSSDLHEALIEGGTSPVKVAHEVLRVLRDPLRAVLELGRLSYSSYLDFQQNLRSRINRLIAGPPALRSEQLLALVDAGVLHTPFGPNPKVEVDAETLTITSTRLENAHSQEPAFLIKGHLEDPHLERSSSPLLSSLYKTGRIDQLRYDGKPVGSVAITADSHPINRSGVVQEKLWIFGAVTEGSRYFTHYLPSPKSRLRIFQEAESTLRSILG